MKVRIYYCVMKAVTAVTSALTIAMGRHGSGQVGLPGEVEVIQHAEANVLEQARAASEQGEWQQAYELLAQEEASTPLAGADLALFADVAYAVGHFDVTIVLWERAHAESVRVGDHLSAAGAAVRVAMHLLFDTALMAPVRGWIRRAERLLEGHEETPVHAWLAVVSNYERMLSGDFQSARQWARRAIEIGTRWDPAAAALGRVAEARSLILGGDSARGLRLLNEAAVAAVSGELDPLSTGIVYCELVCALQALAQYDLAEEWTEAMERWRQGQPVGSVHGRCRVHRAEILRLRGLSSEAEKEVLLACEELRPYLRRELGWPLTELGRIRLRMGDFRGAEEAFLEAHAAGWDPQPGLALLRLAQGEVALAAASIRDALDNPWNVPSKEWPPNTELRRAPLLEAQVEIAVAAGDPDGARAAAEELGRVAAVFESKALAAGAAVAMGRVHLTAGELAVARHDFQEAVRGWNEVGGPYETAEARLGLARTYRAEGNEDQARLEFRAARSGFEQVGAGHQVVMVTRELEEDIPKGRQIQEPRSGSETLTINAQILRRESDYWLVDFDGRTVHLRDLIGLRYLARLLAAPGHDFHVLDLAASDRGEPARRAEPGMTFRVPGDAGALLDGQAKAAYRRRLTEIEEDLEEARALGDIDRAAQAASEREFLIRELSRAVGLGGRDRTAGSAAERARASVTQAIRLAMARIQEHHPQLGEHLDRAIRTGTYCSYQPDSRVSGVWSI